MPVFEVLVPRYSADPLEIELIRDRFSWGAALVPPLWAVLNGLWLELAVWFAGLILIGTSGLFAGGEVAFWLYVLFALWFGLSAADMRAAGLRRAGFAAAGIRIATDEMLATRDWLKETGR